MNEELPRIVLLGKTGAGKSSTGNTIFGDKVFAAKSGKSVTKTCYNEPATVRGKRIQVVDTPGLFDANTLETAAEIDRYITHGFDSFGPIVLVVFATNRLTKEEVDAIKFLETAFGSDALKGLFTIVLRVSDLKEEGTSLEEFLQSYEGKDEENLRERCWGGNVIGFDNTTKVKGEQEKQVEAILKTIDLIARQNRERLYAPEKLQGKNAENGKVEEDQLRKLLQKLDEKRREMLNNSIFYTPVMMRAENEESRIDQKRWLFKSMPDLTPEWKDDEQSTEKANFQLQSRNNKDLEPSPSTTGDVQRDDEKGRDQEKVLTQLKQLKKEEKMYQKAIRERRKALKAKDEQLKEVKDQRLAIEDELQRAKKECEMWMSDVCLRKQMARARMMEEPLLDEELNHRKAVQKHAGRN